MITETVSRLVTNQKPPVEPAQEVIVVCDMAQRDVLAAVSSFLQTTGLVAADANVQLVTPVVFANAKLLGLLNEDQRAARVSFAVIQGNTCRRYFKSADQDEFSLHMTSL